MGEDADVMLSDHTWPRQFARPMSASRGSPRSITLQLCILLASAASVGPPILYGRIRLLAGALPQGTEQGRDARPLAHNVTAACGAVSGGVEQDGGLPSARRGGPRPSSMRGVRAPPSRGVPHSGRRGDRGPKPAQATGQNAGGGVPAFKLQCRRAQRLSLVEEPSTARDRAPQKARMSDSGAQLVPHTGRWDDRGGAVFRSETSDRKSTRLNSSH